MMKTRRNCSNEVRIYNGEPCTNYPKFYLETPAEGIKPICGVCARIYISEALHPLREKDWTDEDWNKYFSGD